MLVGRSLECARIDELLADAAQGRSGALVLRGEPGIGKGALLAYAAEGAAGFRVLTATGAEPDSDFAFSALHELLHPILDRLDQIPGIQARALEGALALADSAGVGRMYVGAAALSVLAAASTIDRPVLCLIDDAQWLDPASADACRFAARRLEAEGVVMLFAATDGARSFDATGLEEVRLEGLNDADAAALLRELAPPVADDVVARLVDATRGNPLALTELPRLLSAQQLAGREPLPHPLPVGERLVSTLVAETRDMTPPARQALLVAAASSTDAMRVIGAPEDDVARSLEEAEALGILALESGRLRFAHPLVRGAIYQAASPAERRAAHQRLADLLRDEPRYRERRAWHLAAAAAGPDEDIAREVEEIAAETERRRAHVNAAALFERAAGLSVDDGHRARRLMEAASSARLAGHADRAARLAAQVLDAATDPSVRAEARIVQGLVSMAAGDALDPSQMLADADAAVSVDPARAARLLSVLSEVSPSSDAVMLASRAVELAPTGSTAEAYATVAEARALARNGATDRATARIDDATQLLRADGDLSEDPEVLLALVDGLADVGAEGSVVEELLQLASASAREHTLVVLPRALLHRSYLEHTRGAWRDAYVHAFEAARLFDETGQPRRAIPARAWLGVVEAWFGHEEAASALAREVRTAAAVGDASVSLDLAAARIDGVLALTVGRADMAAGPLRRWAEGSRSDPSLLPRSAADIVDAIEAQIRNGDDDTAADLRSTLQDADPVSAACRAWADGILAESADASAAAFDAAVSAVEALPTGRPFLSARIALASGERLRRDGERVLARDRLRIALAHFQSLEAEPWAVRTGRELRATGEHVRSRATSSLGELTPQELQVARLIASGATYKEAAARLFLSAKTIEFHLGKVYRKLGVRSGKELAALYAREEFE